MSKFVIFKTKSGEYFFSLKAGNGQEILKSEGYTTRAACDLGIQSVKKNSKNVSLYDRVISTNGQPYFNLKSMSGQIIGTSELYETTTSRDNGITSVMKNAPNADIAILED